MKAFTKAVSLALVSLSVALPATAQTSTKERTGSPTPSARQAARQQQDMYRGSKIIGASVRDQKDKKIGEIKDLVLDSRRGEVAYAVVSFGGVMGVGRKYHAIPWQALQPSDDGKYYVLNADKETITQAPGFDKGDWPNMADQKWSADVDRYWNRMVGRGPPDHGLSTGASGASGAAGSGERAGRDRGDAAR
jgi:sporulation protein YlmC with PRC-barrel domain